MMPQQKIAQLQMRDVFGFQVPIEDYYLHRVHAWAALEGDDRVRVGFPWAAKRTSRLLKAASMIARFPGCSIRSSLYLVPLLERDTVWMFPLAGRAGPSS